MLEKVEGVLTAQAPALRSALVLIYVPGVAFILLTRAITSRYGIPFWQLLDDPIVMLGGEFYHGLLSNLGVLFWAFTAAICLFSASVVRGGPEARFAGFFRDTGLLTLFLLIDDFFLLHDHVLPERMSIDELFVMMAYGVITLYIAARYYSLILITDYLLLGVAMLIFAFSIVVDLLPTWESLGLRYATLLEELSKFFGIISWFYYFVRTCRERVTRAGRSPGPTAAGIRGVHPPEG